MLVTVTYPVQVCSVSTQRSLGTSSGSHQYNLSSIWLWTNRTEETVSNRPLLLQTVRRWPLSGPRAVLITLADWAHMVLPHTHTHTHTIVFKISVGTVPSSCRTEALVQLSHCKHILGFSTRVHTHTHTHTHTQTNQPPRATRVPVRSYILSDTHTWAHTHTHL